MMYMNAKYVEFICKSYDALQRFPSIQAAAKYNKDFYYEILDDVFEKADEYECYEDYEKDLWDIIENAFWWHGPNWYEEHGFKWHLREEDCKE